jgi:hypothetical protein
MIAEPGQAHQRLAMPLTTRTLPLATWGGRADRHCLRRPVQASFAMSNLGGVAMSNLEVVNLEGQTLRTAMAFFIVAGRNRHMRHALPVLLLLLVAACARGPQPAMPPDNGTAGEAEREPPTGVNGIGGVGERQQEKNHATRNGEHSTSPEFPWPLPAPSAFSIVPEELLPAPVPGTTLRQVANHLSTALQSQGYVAMSWFRIPHGFALVTQLEQIKADGTPVPPPGRWGDRLRAERIHNLKDYLRGLFVAPAGRFRLLVFLVTSATVPLGEPVQREEARAWLSAGSLALDPATGAQTYTPEHKVFVLIYEFEKPSSTAQADLVTPSLLSALEHLRAAGLFEALQSPP